VKLLSLGTFNLLLIRIEEYEVTGKNLCKVIAMKSDKALEAVQAITETLVTELKSNANEDIKKGDAREKVKVNPEECDEDESSIESERTNCKDRRASQQKQRKEFIKINTRIKRYQKNIKKNKLPHESIPFNYDTEHKPSENVLKISKIIPATNSTSIIKRSSAQHRLRSYSTRRGPEKYAVGSRVIFGTPNRNQLTGCKIMRVITFFRKEQDNVDVTKEDKNVKKVSLNQLAQHKDRLILIESKAIHVGYLSNQRAKSFKVSHLQRNSCYGIMTENYKVEQKINRNRHEINKERLMTGRSKLFQAKTKCSVMNF